MKNSLLFILGVFFLLSCEDKKSTTPETPQPTTTVQTVKAPRFSADSAYKFIEQQVAFGPRVPNSKEHKACADYLISFLRANTDTVFTQQFTSTAFDGTVLNLTNIVGSINPSASKRIMLSAHWDTRPFSDQEKEENLWRKPIDGANDGGSGVGILMEVARALTQAETIEVGVDIVLFDGEDYGAPHFHEGERDLTTWCLGSQYWSKTPHKPGYRAYYGVLLDMAGAKGAKFFKEGVSMQYAPIVVDKVWGKAQQLGFGSFFVNEHSDPITDDHTFINSIAGIPTIDIIQHDPNSNNFYFGNYWHTQDDNMEVIGKETLNAVGQTLLEVLYTE